MAQWLRAKNKPEWRNRPPLLLGLGNIYRAFQECAATYPDRLCPITEIIAWCDANRIAVGDRRDFYIRAVRHLDTLRNKE